MCVLGPVTWAEAVVAVIAVAIAVVNRQRASVIVLPFAGAGVMPVRAGGS